MSESTRLETVKIIMLKGEKGDQGDGSYDDTEVRGLITAEARERASEVNSLQITKADKTELAVESARIDTVISQTRSEVVTLWTGTMSASGGTYTLSESVANFDFIDIYCENLSTHFVRIPADKSSLNLFIPYFDNSSSNKPLEIGKLALSISGTSVTLSAPKEWFWDGETSEDATVTDAQVSVPVRIDGVRYARLESSEVADIRVGADGIAYASAGDAVRGQYNNLNDKILEIHDWKNTLTYEATANVNNPITPFYVNKGEILTVTSTDYRTSHRLTLYFADGTNITSIQMGNKIRYRAVKDIISVSVYAATIDITVTFTKSQEPLYLTNYYDKSTKISGFISDGTLYNGYYHSDYIPIALGEKIIFSGYYSTFGTVRAFFYNDEKTYMGKINATLRDDGLYELTAGLGAIGVNFTSGNIYYVVFNMSVAGSDTAVFYKEDVPYDNSVAYGQHLPEDEELFFNEIQKDYIANAGSQPIAGKKIAYNGDSIAESRLTTGNTYNGGAYPKMIADLTGGTYENRSHGGGILASQAGDGGSAPARCVVSDVINMASNADLICFEGGINDYWRQVPLGDYSESDYSSTLDTTTICGALESIFRQAKQKWVGKPICFVITHKIKSTVYVANSAGYTWMQVHEKMVGICKKYAIPYYDAFEESGLNAYDDIQNTTFLTSNSSGTADGCHPNEAGYQKYYVPQLINLFNRIIPRS